MMTHRQIYKALAQIIQLPVGDERRSLLRVSGPLSLENVEELRQKLMALLEKLDYNRTVYDFEAYYRTHLPQTRHAQRGEPEQPERPPSHPSQPRRSPMPSDIQDIMRYVTSAPAVLPDDMIPDSHMAEWRRAYEAPLADAGNVTFRVPTTTNFWEPSRVLPSVAFDEGVEFPAADEI